MFTQTIDPVLFHLGPFSIRYYGLVYVIGFLLVYYVLMKKREEFKLTKNDVESFVLYLIIGVVAGARLFEVIIWDLVYYFSSPLKIFAVWEGGMSLHGGIAGALLVGFYFCRKHKINFWKMADIVVIPGIFILAVGRIANFINSELVGTITNLPWCFNFPDYEGCRHPVQLYAAAGRFLLFGYLAALLKIKRWKDGFIFWNFVLLMGIGRFVCDFLRDDARYLGLSTGQYLSLAMVAAAGYILIKYYKRKT